MRRLAVTGTKRSSLLSDLSTASEALDMTVFEDFVTEEVLKGRSILGLYPVTEESTTAAFTAWRINIGR